MVMYDNEFETKENIIQTKKKFESQHLQIRCHDFHILVLLVTSSLVKLVYRWFEKVFKS